MATANKKVPAVLHIRVGRLSPLIERWAEKNKGCKWSYLLENALKKELQALACKRTRHLVES